MKRLAFIMMALLLALMPKQQHRIIVTVDITTAGQTVSTTVTTTTAHITDSASVLPSPLSIPTIPVWMVATGRPA